MKGSMAELQKIETRDLAVYRLAGLKLLDTDPSGDGLGHGDCYSDGDGLGFNHGDGDGFGFGDGDGEGDGAGWGYDSLVSD